MAENISYDFSDTHAIPVGAVQDLRQSVGLVADSSQVWEEAMTDALGVASAWQETELVGIGFLVGTRRHAILCDLAVAPDHRQNGIGRRLAEQLVDTARQKEVRYTTLYYNEARPWLANFYQSLGFQAMTNGMQRLGQ